MSSTENKKINDKLKEIKGGIFSMLIDNYRYIRDNFYKILDGVINSKNYKYSVGFLLTLVFILLIVLTNLINVPDKYIQIITLLLGGIIISIFYFFVYRNEQESDHGLAVKGEKNLLYSQINLYTKERKKLVKEIDEKGDSNVKKTIFDSENFKNSIYNPVKNLIKFFGVQIFTILAIVLLIVFIYNLYIKYEYLYVFTKLFLGFI